MSREIKGRVWDPNSRTMDYECDDVTFFHGIVCCEGDGIFMLSTGLKDKNRVEIYEGDILRSHFPGRRDIPTRLEGVQWCDRDAAFEAVDHPSPVPNRLEGRLHPVWWGRTCEIVGNIYENPELLEAR